jgi:hypothetical protein
MKWIKQNEWNLVVAVAFLSFVCGIFGVNDTLLMSGKSAPCPDLVYFSIRLFFFNYDDSNKKDPGEMTDEEITWGIENALSVILGESAYVQRNTQTISS